MRFPLLLDAFRLAFLERPVISWPCEALTCLIRCNVVLLHRSIPVRSLTFVFVLHYYRYHHNKGIGNSYALPWTKPHRGWIDGYDPRGEFVVSTDLFILKFFPRVISHVMCRWSPPDWCRWQWNYRFPWIFDNDGPQDEGHWQWRRNPWSLQGLW